MAVRRDVEPSEPANDAPIPCSVCGEPFVPSGRRNLRIVRPACSSCQEKARRMRPTFAPAKTESIRRMSRTELADGRRLYPVENIVRPRTRAGCIDGARPCPFVSCQYHLALDVTDIGSIKWNFPGVELEDMPETCALDVADRGSSTLEEVGALMNFTRERVRQVEEIVFRRLRASDGCDVDELREAMLDGGFLRREATAQDLEEENAGSGGTPMPEVVPVPAFLRGEDGPLAARLLRAWRELSDAERNEIDVWAEIVARRMSDGLPLRSAVAVGWESVENHAAAMGLARPAEVAAASAPGVYAETLTEGQAAKLLRPVPGVVRSLRKDPPPKNVLGQEAVREAFGIEEETMGDMAGRGESQAAVLAALRRRGACSVAELRADIPQVPRGSVSGSLSLLRAKGLARSLGEGRWEPAEAGGDAPAAAPKRAKTRTPARAARVSRPKAPPPELPADLAADAVIAPLLAQEAKLERQLAGVRDAIAAYRAAMVGA